MTIRVLHCPASVGGHPQGLAEAERSVGLDSVSVVFHPSPYGYESDEVLFEDDPGPLAREWRRWKLLRRAARDFDVIHFNFGATIMPHREPDATPGTSLGRRLFAGYAHAFELRDAAWLRAAGKVIAVTFQGDDARQGDRSFQGLAVSAAAEVEPGYYTPPSDARKRLRIARFARSADLIYALNPDLLRVLPTRARFLPYANFDPRGWKLAAFEPNAVPRVVHAPTHRGVKGTRFVVDAVSRLRARGIEVELVLVEGMSHVEARRVLASADLVVDQLLIGWYGSVALEAMALGKPVVCYVRDEDLRFVPEGMALELPVIRARPDDVADVLGDWLTSRRGELAGVGRLGRAYVERWHDPVSVASRVKADYEDALERRRR